MPASNMDVSITVTSTKQSLYTILALINANAPRLGTRIEITGDIAQTVDVLVGGPQLSDTNYSYRIGNPGDVYSDSTNDRNAISIPNVYLKVEGAGANQTVHCRVRIF